MSLFVSGGVPSTPRRFKEGQLRRSTVVAVAVCVLIGAMSGRVVAEGYPSPTAERFILSGVMFLEDGPGLAWLQEQSLTGNRVVTMRPGESIGPYRLIRILEDRVELQGPGGTVLVPVYNAQGPAATAVASAAPGAAGGVAPVPARSASAAAGPVGWPAFGPAQPGGAVSAADSRGDGGAAMKALRDRLEMARRELGQSQAEPARAEPQAPGRARAPQPAAQIPSGGNADVIYPPKGDTFQSILGLK
jgi:hypothetical protein